jgi:transposase
MITPPADVRIVLMAEPVDFRRGAPGLARLVAQYLQEHPFGGDVFVFRAKRADRVKILGHDGTGLWLYQKRLETGRFVWPSRDQTTVRMTPAQLGVLLDGVDWRRVRAGRRLRPQRAA